MKRIGNLLDKKRLVSRKALDQGSVFYVFQQVIREEYGRQGSENIKPVFFKDRKIFVKITNSFWADEVWLQRKLIISKTNERLGGEEVIDLAMSQ